MDLELVRNKTDDELIAATIYHEARGEGWRGMLAVAHVIVNRVKARSWYGANVFEVVTKPWQFSCHNGEFQDYHNDASLLIAQMVLAGATVDITGGADHYHADYLAPDWASEMNFCKRIGRHVFYRAEPFRSFTPARILAPVERPDFHVDYSEYESQLLPAEAGELARSYRVARALESTDGDSS